MRLPVVRAEYVTGKMFLMASRSSPFQVLPDHEIQTHPEIINYFNKRTFSHLKRGIIFTAYLCPKGVPSINELALVRHFDLYRQKALYKYKVWWSNSSSLLESHPRCRREAVERFALPRLASPARSHLQAHTHAGRSWWKLHCVWGLTALFPYIVNGEGIPLCSYFQFTFQDSIGNKTDFQLWFIRAWYDRARHYASDHRLFRVWTQGAAPAQNHAAVITKRARLCMYM